MYVSVTETETETKDKIGKCEIQQHSVELSNCFKYIRSHTSERNGLHAFSSTRSFAKKLYSQNVYQYWCQCEHVFCVRTHATEGSDVRIHLHKRSSSEYHTHTHARAVNFVSERIVHSRNTRKYVIRFRMASTTHTHIDVYAKMACINKFANDILSRSNVFAAVLKVNDSKRHTYLQK